MIPREAGVGEGGESRKDWEGGKRRRKRRWWLGSKRRQTDRNGVRYFDSASFPFSFPRRSRALCGIPYWYQETNSSTIDGFVCPLEIGVRERKRRSQIEICPPSFHLVCCPRTSTYSVAPSEMRNKRPGLKVIFLRRKERKSPQARTDPRKIREANQSRGKTRIALGSCPDYL